MSGRAVRRGVVLGMVLAALALLVVACGNDEEGGAASATVEPTETVDAAALLERAAARVEEAGSFRFRLEHENGGTVILEALEMESGEGEVAGPDTMSLTAKAQAGPLSVDIGIVVLPDESWVTNPLTGRWERQDIDVSAFFDPARGVTALMRGIHDARVSGTQRMGGVETYVVDATVDSGDLDAFVQGAPAGTTLPVRAWIGVDDPLLYRVDVTGGISAAEPENLVRRLTFRDWGAEISISPPR